MAIIRRQKHPDALYKDTTRISLIDLLHDVKGNKLLRQELPRVSIFLVRHAALSSSSNSVDPLILVSRVDRKPITSSDHVKTMLFERTEKITAEARDIKKPMRTRRKEAKAEVEVEVEVEVKVEEEAKGGCENLCPEKRKRVVEGG
ncbi:hypothetical protein HZH68_014967 [Vespula germanica]|uniref:Uncharacterized protein n=2 Tax=Vespula TaxID=7451 RepID=A0A834MU62_VESGE|nr:hypothetical protein HZH66_013494 [Vespula vulgaris]KAF7383118.1 hypothetical protein HZH68_014967 [Vespula germanica]